MSEFVFEPVRYRALVARIRRTAKRASRFSGEDSYEQLAAEANAIDDGPPRGQSAKATLELAARAAAAAGREWIERHQLERQLPRRMLRSLHLREALRAGGELGYTREPAVAFEPREFEVPGLLAPALDAGALDLIEAVVVADPKLDRRAQALHPPRPQTRARVEELFARVLSEDGAATLAEIASAETREIFSYDVRRRVFGADVPLETPLPETIPEQALSAVLRDLTDPRLYVDSEFAESALRAAVWLLDLAELGAESQLTAQIRGLAAAIDGSGLAEQPTLVSRGWLLERAREHAVNAVDALGRLARDDSNGRFYVAAAATAIVRPLALELMAQPGARTLSFRGAAAVA